MLAFRAYDSNCNGWIEKEELADMLVNLAELKGSLTLTQYEVNNQVSLIAEKFDFDRDGKLNFQEFRAAAISSFLSLTPFFGSYVMQSGDLRTYGESITCYRCSTKFLPANGFAGGLAKLCPSCTISTPRTPSRYL